MNKNKIFFLLCCVVGFVAVGAQADAKKIRIGLSMDTLKEERWQRDRDLFVKRAQELGAEVLVQAANSNDALQASQVENLLTQKIDVLVLVPHNAVSAAKMVQSAHSAGVPVLSYDRLVRNADVDLYVSFDNVKVGKLQAEALLKLAPKGNYMVIGGSPTDNNALLFREGQMQALKPLEAKKEIQIVADQMTQDWQPATAMKHVENALTRNQNKVVAIVATNDGMAGGVISALKAQGLAGKVLVSGQDADLAACQRIVEGTQTMTVYKPIALLAHHAAEAAILLAKKQPVKLATHRVPNGKIDVPSILLEPVVVNKANLDQTILRDGYHKREDVYR